MKRDDLTTYVQKLSLSSLLVGPGSGFDSEVLFDESHAVAATRRLRSVWISRLMELRKLDPETVPDDDSLIFARNCPPSFALTNERARPCQKIRICPFCWARSVSSMFKRIATVLYGTNLRVCLDAETRKVVECHPLGVDLYELIDEDWMSPDVAIETVIRGHSKRLQNWYREFRSAGIGGLSRTSFSPVSVDGYEIKSRSLIMVPVGTPKKRLPPLCGAADYKVTKYPVNQRELAAAVGRTLQYPAGLLTGNAGLVMNLLAAMQKGRGKSPRLQATYGIIRKSTSVEDEEEVTIEDESN